MSFYLPDNYYDPPEPNADCESYRVCVPCTRIAADAADENDTEYGDVVHSVYWERWGTTVTFFCDVAEESWDEEMERE